MDSLVLSEETAVYNYVICKSFLLRLRIAAGLESSKLK